MIPFDWREVNSLLPAAAGKALTEDQVMDFPWLFQGVGVVRMSGAGVTPTASFNTAARQSVSSEALWYCSRPRLQQLRETLWKSPSNDHQILKIGLRELFKGAWKSPKTT